MDQGFNLAPLLSSLAQAVPVWAIVGFTALWIVRRFERAWEQMQQDISEIKHGQEEIRIQLAGFNVNDMHRRIDNLENQNQAIEDEMREILRKSTAKKREI